MTGTKIELVKYEATDPRLGRHVEHDERSKMAMFAQARTLKPKKKDTFWTSHSPTIQQGDVGSCTCSSQMVWFNTDFATAARQSILGAANYYFTQEHALELYKLATRLDPFPGSWPEEDTGSSGNAAAKASVRKKWLTSYTWIFSFTSLQAMIEKTPLQVGTLWTNDMFNPVNGLVKVGALTDANIAGGHEYCMVGIDWQNELFIFRQTWGDDWDGAKPGGYFAISFKDFARLQEADGDVTVPRWVGSRP